MSERGGWDLQRGNELERKELDTQQQSTCLRFLPSTERMFQMHELLPMCFCACFLSGTAS
jgi:hypothetical protein